jgi:Flp pilus assembly protein TadG
VTRRRLGDDRGAVVAEFAVALPALVIVIVLAAGVLGAGARGVRLQDAAADAARLAARGESEERVHAVVAQAAAGASARIEKRGDLVCVIASSPAGLPFTLTASSCALAGGL